jgi:hypothetical protein
MTVAITASVYGAIIVVIIITSSFSLPDLLSQQFILAL